MPVLGLETHRMVPFNARPLGSIPGDAVRLSWTRLEAHSLRGRQLQGRPKRRWWESNTSAFHIGLKPHFSHLWPRCAVRYRPAKSQLCSQPFPCNLTPLVSRQPVSCCLN